MQKLDTQNERIKTGGKANYRFWKRKKVVVVNKIQLYYELNKLQYCQYSRHKHKRTETKHIGLITDRETQKKHMHRH